MNNGAFGENFPYSNFHDLNMDWIIKIAKDFLDQYTHIQETIADGEQSLQDLTTEGLQQLQEKADNLEELLQQWYDTHSEDIANQLADALDDLNEWYNTHSEDIAQQLTTAISEFNQSAEEKAREVIESIPGTYQEVVGRINDLDFMNNYEGNLLKKGDWTQSASQNMTYTPNDDGTITITGTQVSTTFHDFYLSGTELPSWYPTNCFYRIALNGYENQNGKVQLNVYSFNGSNVQNIATGITIGNDIVFYMPTTAMYYGLIIRINVIGAINSAYSAVVTPQLYRLNTEYFIPKYLNTNFRCTDAVLLALNTYNRVKFDEGTFVIDSPIELPNNARVEGSGNQTIIMLGGNATYAFNLTKENEISNIAFNLGAVDISAIGAGSAIRYYKETYDASDLGKIGIIHDCWFRNCAYSGIEMQNTGGRTNCGLLISNCYFEHCWCGISILSRSEYNIIDDCVFYDCTNCVINNGGNNKFSNCTFQANDTAFYLNSDPNTTQINDGHGQCINCSFNHMGSLAIRVRQLNHGYDFIGCQFWFSKIRIANAKGIKFADCTFGEATPLFEQDGSYPVFIENSLFFSDPRPNWYVNSNLRLVSCYDFDGNAITNN